MSIAQTLCRFAGRNEVKTMHTAIDSIAGGGPLTPEHQQQVLVANQRTAKLRMAAKMAWFNGWVTGIFALLSAPFALFSLAGLVVTLGLIVVAYNEFRGRRLLLAYDPRAPYLLGWNQVGFMGLIIGYSLWMIVEGFAGPTPLAAELNANPDLQAMLGSPAELQEMYQLLLLAVYGTSILLSALFQGINALYYFTRRSSLNAYLQETPVWIRQLQRISYVA